MVYEYVTLYHTDVCQREAIHFCGYGCELLRTVFISQRNYDEYVQRV